MLVTVVSHKVTVICMVLVAIHIVSSTVTMNVSGSNSISVCQQGIQNLSDEQAEQLVGKDEKVHSGSV